MKKQEQGMTGAHPAQQDGRLRQAQLKMLEMVYDYFGQFSALKLMNLTHNETPWNSVEMMEEITEESLIDFFNTIVVK